MRVPLSKVFSFIISERRDYFYGESNPSTSKRYVYNILFIVVLLAFWGYNADFIITNLWSKICLYCSGIATIIFCAFWYFTGVPIADDLGKPLRILIMLAVFPSIIFFTFYVATAHGISNILTNFIGSQKSITTSVTKQIYSGNRACRHQISGLLFNNAMPSYLCISKSEFELLPSEMFEVTLTGKQSYLGFNVDSWSQNIRTSGHP